MSDGGGRYLFDVGVVALAHAGTPVSETALSYVKDAIRGDIDAVIPYPALFGPHVVLTNYYGFSNADASRLMQKLMDASRIHWHDTIPGSVVRDGFARAAVSRTWTAWRRRLSSHSPSLPRWTSTSGADRA